MVLLDQPPKFRALVADDDTIVCRILSYALSAEGFDCDTSGDGESALDLLSNESDYDLLITDIRMPKKDGHALAMDVLGSQPQVVVMVHTAVREPLLAADLVFHGVEDVVFKPTDYREFAAKARGLVTRRRRHDRGLAGNHQSAPAASPEEPPEFFTLGGEGASRPVTAADVLKRSADVEHIFPFFQDALELYALFTRDECDPERLAEQLEQEVYLSAEVLRMANATHSSSKHGEINSISQAITRLGRRAVGDLVLSASGQRAVTAYGFSWIDRELLWTRSRVAAIALRTLHEKSSICADDPDFLCTLLHPVGRIMLATLFPEEHRRLSKHCRETGLSLDLAEARCFGLTHGQLTSRLLSSWGVPEESTRPLSYAAMPFAELYEFPESVRQRIEHVKLSLLLSNIVTGLWQPWDTIDLPSGDLFHRLNVDSTAETLSAVRSALDLPLSIASGELVGPENCPVHSPMPEILYRTRSNGSLDLVPFLLSSLGVRLLQHIENKEQRVLINGLYRGPGLEKLIESETSSRLLGIVREIRAAELFAPAPAVLLPTTVHSLLKQLAADVPQSMAGKPCR